MPPSSDHGPSSQLELAFEDNKLAAQLYGDFDQHLALIEQRLSVQATPRGNHVMLKGGATSVDQARRHLEMGTASRTNGYLLGDQPYARGIAPRHEPEAVRRA